MPGDGDGEEMPGDGDGEEMPGDGDGEEMPGDGDGEEMPGDGDGEEMPGDGDGEEMPVDGDGEEMPGDGDGMMPEPEPDLEAQALANAIDLVANNSRQDDDGERTNRSWYPSKGFFAPRATLSRSYRDGGYVGVIVSHDENGQLQHDVNISPLHDVAPLQETPVRVQANRLINTDFIAEDLEGVARSVRSISDHDLGPIWQVSELKHDYEDGGTLEIYVATNLQVSDMSRSPFADISQYGRTILLDDVPDLPASQDVLEILLSHGDSITGTLDGVAGTFSCSTSFGCAFYDDRRPGEAFPGYGDIVFAPEDGTADVSLPAADPIPFVPAADYLAFGRWLYVPEDVTDTDAYDFGVFASGGDPFEVSNLGGLTGTASYVGDASGMYYVNGLSSSPDVGSFTADVALTADFSDGSATGTVEGELNNFMFEGDVASSLPAAVTLTATPHSSIFEGFGVEQGSTNIFDTAWGGQQAPYPGGWVGGTTEASVDGTAWYGDWNGVFYGNGAASTDHPTSVAGTFGTYLWNDEAQSDSGLTGSFGAHRQQQ